MTLTKPSTSALVLTAKLLSRPRPTPIRGPTPFSPSTILIPCEPPTSRGSGLTTSRIWYNFCMLSLLQPFVTSSASVVDGLPPSLTGDTTPQTVCRQASEAIISFTSTYQARYSLAYLPPLLPYMVFAAVLQQASLTAPPSYQARQQEQLVESPEPLSPKPMYGPPSSLSVRKSSNPSAASHFATTRLSAPVPEPSSCPPARQASGSAQRKDSAISTSSTCFSNDDQVRRPSICSFVSSATSEMAGSPSPVSSDAKSDTLPTFTLQPGDLVTVGLLQLASMGAQHPGAAEAAHLLRTVGSQEEITKLHPPSGPFPGPMPIPCGGLDVPPGLPVGLGAQVISERGAGYRVVSSDNTPGPASVPGFGLKIPAEMTGPPPSGSCSKPRRPPAPPAFRV